MDAMIFYALLSNIFIVSISALLVHIVSCVNFESKCYSLKMKYDAVGSTFESRNFQLRHRLRWNGGGGAALLFLRYENSGEVQRLRAADL